MGNINTDAQMRSRISCCRGCGSREIGCHGKCDSYIKQKEHKEAEDREYRKKKELESMAISYVVHTMQRMTGRKTKEQ